MRKLFTTSFAQWLLALMLFCASWNAHASVHITNRGYWEDRSGQATFEQAKEQQYKAFEGVLSRGYTRSATWIRLTVSPVSAHELVLRIRPVYLDEIRLYDPLDTSGSERKVGDTTHYKHSEYPSLAYTFVIPGGSQPREVWLRMVTTSTSMVDIEAFTPEELQGSELHMQLLYFGVLAVIAMFMLLVLGNWIGQRESLQAFFVLRQIYFLFYTAALFGLHRHFLSGVMSPDALDMLFSCMAIGATALTFGFEYKFLSEYSPPKWVKTVLYGLFVWCLLVVTLLLSGHVMLALKFNMILNTVGVVTLFFLALVFIDDQKPQARPASSRLSKKIVVSYYLSINLVLMFTVLPFLGVIKGNDFAVNGLVFYALTSGVFMTVLMHLRARQIRQAQMAIEQELLISQKEVELEKQRREEQTHLLHMLMHELKNPLAIIDMAVLAQNDWQKTRAYVSRAVRTMKAVVDRCVKADRLTSGDLAVNKTTVNIRVFLRALLIQQGHETDRVVLDVQDGLTVHTDEQFLEIMCSNLIENALRYGDSQTPVSIQAHTKRNAHNELGVCIAVANRPRSASWPDPEKLFTKYYRSAGAEAQSGTGLGLYLVRSMSRLLGGDCVYAPDEHNIRFELWLPS